MLGEFVIVMVKSAGSIGSSAKIFLDPKGEISFMNNFCSKCLIMFKCLWLDFRSKGLGPEEADANDVKSANNSSATIENIKAIEGIILFMGLK